ncbi:SusC/RagA family TonB-linked outer membrane protein [Chryseobacterium wangxinyae]|uniref:SusC/RagA family TonB-linked outer membrane protein n=1 Tax=Chryseobacterium sp. CY353 TaxID=2997334 RepID=UPI00226FCDA0|nr:SusC/RagA family TonB-linked outer membrane protein [Chryseobacterium sp. CY353]MCY0969950.1 SusC/RagA family TonB-linked outer membrane protein [Chryseobacterium sp. CY353]
MRKETQKLLLLSVLGLVSVDMAAQQQMKRDTVKNIEEVVVTALGIKRQDRSLGYVAEKVDGEEFTKTQNNNWAQALEGKVAGLKIQTAGAGPLGSAKITLRGSASMNMDNNQALIVVDGVPLGGTNTGTGNAAYGAGTGGDLPVDFGNNFNSINPEDIESVTILKGATAGALYGSRGMHGAIMITTKAGKSKNGKVNVIFNSNTSFDSVLHWPDYQYEYGQGTLQKNTAGQFYYSYGASPDGVNTGSTSSAFGPKFNGQSYFQYDPTVEGQSLQRQEWRPYKNNIKDFWGVGTTYANNLSVESSTEKTAFRASLNYTKNNWMMPNTGFDRFSGALSIDHNANEKLHIVTKFSYNSTESDNLPATGYNNQSISYFMIFQNPNVDLNWYKPIWKNGQNQIDQIHPFSSFIDNPYLIAYEMLNGLDKKFITGNVTATYKFAKNFDVMLRSGLELTDELRTTKRPYSSANYLQGYYREQQIKNSEFNTDVLFSYKNNFGKFGFNASAGGNLRYNEYVLNDYRATGLKIPGLYELTNAIALITKVPQPRDKEMNSLYGLASLNYNNVWFLDVTARNDWSSALPKENRSYFYPSLATSFILSDIFNLKSNNFNFWKLRASWSMVGSDTDPYNLLQTYNTSDFNNSAEIASIYFNPNLKPEMNTNIEAGMDFSFLKNRLTYNLTVYQNNTDNQIIPVPTLIETGYSTRIINAGEIRNRGIEMTLGAYPVKTQNFSWSVNANWSMNRNKILSLPGEFNGEPYTMSSVGGVVFFNAVVGGSLGDMYGAKLQRSPDGQVIYGSDGLTAKSTKIEYVGNAYAKWRGGLQNTFKYKNLSFSFSIDGQYGGMVYSQSHHKMSEQGKLENTLPGRDNPNGTFVGAGVVQNADGSFSTNTKAVALHTYYGDYYRRANIETNSFDASFIKLREATITYDFPKDIVKNLKMSNLSLSLYGRNLMMLTKNFPLFDPEAATLNDSSITPGVEVGQLPTARTVGIQLNAKF